MLVHILDDLVRIPKQNPLVQPGLLPEGIIPLAYFKYGMVWYSMDWNGVVWCDVVWCGLVWSGLFCLRRILLCWSDSLSPTRKHSRNWRHFDLVDEHLLDTKLAHVLHSPFQVHVPTYYKEFISVTFCRLMESSSRRMGAKKPKYKVFHQEILASPSHCEIIIKKQSTIFQSTERSTTTRSQEM